MSFIERFQVTLVAGSGYLWIPDPTNDFERIFSTRSQSSSAKIPSRSIAFCSCRTLPGQLSCSKSLTSSDSILQSDPTKLLTSNCTSPAPRLPRRYTPRILEPLQDRFDCNGNAWPNRHCPFRNGQRRRFRVASVQLPIANRKATRSGSSFYQPIQHYLSRFFGSSTGRSTVFLTGASLT